MEVQSTRSGKRFIQFEEGEVINTHAVVKLGIEQGLVESGEGHRSISIHGPASWCRTNPKLRWWAVEFYQDHLGPIPPGGRR